MASKPKISRYTDGVWKEVANFGDFLTAEDKQTLNDAISKKLDSNGHIAAFAKELPSLQGIPNWATGTVSGLTTYVLTSLHAESHSGTVAINSVTSTSGRYYKIEYDKDGNLMVNVPWTSGTSTDTNYYPIRSYTSGLQISSGSGSTDCALYVPYQGNGSVSRQGIWRYITYSTSTSSSSRIKISQIAGYGVGTYIIIPIRATFGMYMYNSSGTEIGTYGASNGCNPLCIAITSTSQTSATVYVNGTSFAVGSLTKVIVYKLTDTYTTG